MTAAYAPRSEPSAATAVARLRVMALCFFLFFCTAAASNDNDGFAAGRFEASGKQRRYLLRRPATGARPTAIVLMLHGHTGSPEQLIGRKGRAAPYRRWSDIADRENLLLIAPQGLEGNDGYSGWNDCRADAETNPTDDDARFLTELIADAQRRYRTTSSRVYVVGTSNGGMMALRLAIERPERVTATAAIVAAMPAHSECAEPQRAEPVMFVNGTEDPLLPFTGGRIGKDRAGRGEALSATDSIAIWARLAGASDPPRIVRLPDVSPDDGSTVLHETYAMRDGVPLAVLARIVGGGHTEPSRSQRYPRWTALLLGAQNGDIESADRIWDFFRAQSH